MPLFGKKENVLLETSLSIGEFDPSAEGAYRNVKTFPLNVNKGRLSVSVDSSCPIDLALSNSDGVCIKFKDSLTKGTIAVETKKKETIALVLGIYRGDKADLSVKAWME